MRRFEWLAAAEHQKVLSSFKKGFVQLCHIINRHHWHHHYIIIIIYIYIYLIYKLNGCSIHLFRSSCIERTDLNWHFSIIRQIQNCHPLLYSWMSEMNSYSHKSNRDPSVHLVPKEIPEVSTAVEAWHMHLRRQTVVPGMGAISIAKSWRVAGTEMNRHDTLWSIDTTS